MRWVLAAVLLASVWVGHAWDERWLVERGAGKAPKGEVRVGMLITRVSAPEPLNNTFHLNVHVHQVWEDSRLRWNRSEHGVDVVHPVDKHPFWRPDTYFVNAEELETDHRHHHNKLTIDSNGNVLWSYHAVVGLWCEVDLRHYPFDSQQCHADIASFSKAHVINFTTIESDGLPAYEIRSRETGQFILNCVETSVTPSGALRYSFSFQRGRNTTVLFTFLPLWLLVLLSALLLWVDPFAPTARVHGVLLVFVFLQFAAIFTRDRPQVGYPTSLDIYTMISLIAVTLNTIEYCFINYLYTRLETRKGLVQLRSTFLQRNAPHGAATAVVNAVMPPKGLLFSPREHLPLRTPRGDGSRWDLYPEDLSPRGNEGDTARGERSSPPASPRSRASPSPRIQSVRKRRQARRMAERMADLNEVFRAFDADKSRFLEEEELAPLLLAFGVDPDAIPFIIDQADINGDGLIDFVEFCDLMDLLFPPDGTERSVTFCCWQISAGAVRKIESRYRVAAPLVFAVFTAIWLSYTAMA
eukprot:Sspe_Gene.96103::Locus_68496_Transcript_1_1_Confidence_1.000_Length_1703::g.96103::m.96103/K05181/GABRB; gamma-aminobutyric acid receptor subunit beta